ncbi:MAG: hypothetical protein HZA62_14090 [Rhodocyclales bacterium]|nr:hypothetical protein [Rhodocyclales bacterium]
MKSLLVRCNALFLSILLLAPLALAQAATDDAFAVALSQFNRARQGDTGQIEPTIAAFQAVPANPRHQPLYAAYLGSAHALKGRAAWMPWNKMKYTDQGLDHIDQALASLRPEHDRVLVQGVPLGMTARLVAAATFIAVPDGIFHRRATGKSLLAELRRSPLLASTPEGFRAELEVVEALLKEAEK